MHNNMSWLLKLKIYLFGYLLMITEPAMCNLSEIKR